MPRASSPLPSSLLTLGIAALACTGGPAQAPPAPTPEPPKPEVSPAEATSDQKKDPGAVEWPLTTMGIVPPGRSTALPADQRLIDLDVAPAGNFAALVTAGVTGKTTLWRWDFASEPIPLGARWADAEVQEVAFSQFDGSLYEIAHSDDVWRVDRVVDGERGTPVVSPLYKSKVPLSHLVVPYTRYNGRERAFFARADPDGTRILGVNRLGTGIYEVTSPTGTLGALTDADVRAPTDEQTVAPNVLAAPYAAPLSVNSRDGTMLWAAADGALHEHRWGETENNWANDAPISRSAAVEVYSPNGYYTQRWKAGERGVAYLNPDGSVAGMAAKDVLFLSMPATAVNGRTLVGATAQGVVTVDVDVPLAAVRFLEQAGGVEVRSALATKGLAVADTSSDQIYQPYEALAYDQDNSPVFASVDGLLEVLHAGFQAVFVRVESDISRPRLQTFLTALSATATRTGQARVATIADLAGRMSRGDYASPEGALVLAEALAQSAAHGAEIDFQDFHPRGPYATSKELSDYFRAFKYINELRLTDAERETLAGDADLVKAWSAWVGTQQPFMSGSRQMGMFATAGALPAYVSPECLPVALQQDPRRIFPLSWGKDSEILERSTAHDALPAECTVPQRVVPSGLDLLTALGSEEAAALQRPEYARWPELASTQAALVAKFGGPMPSDSVVGGWLRLLQILGNERYVPEGVNAEAWRHRLLETALASWTSYRHTTVLVNEASAAEYGGGPDTAFEYLDVEPVRGVVDPVPAAWTQLSDLLTMLAEQAAAAPTTDRLAKVLGESADDAKEYARIASSQMRGVALTEGDYERIRWFGRDVEHPFLLFSAAAAGKGDTLSGPEPMMRIVDIHRWNDPDGPAQSWHAAVGRPRAITVLIGDRGVLVPGSGAVYSYYEVVAEQRLDDEAWRARVDTETRPAWVNQ